MISDKEVKDALRILDDIRVSEGATLTEKDNWFISLGILQKGIGI